MQYPKRRSDKEFIMNTVAKLCTAESITKFLASLDIRQSSKKTYERQLKEFFAWCKQYKVTSLEREDLLRYKLYLSKERSLAAFTISGYLTAMRRFFEWLEAYQKHTNVARGIKGPSRKRDVRKDSLTV